MALSEKHRNAIYQHLLPEWGDDVTEAFLSQFPAVEADELVTRDHLRAELAVTRGDLRSEMHVLRGELRAEMGELRTGLATLDAHFEARLSAHRAEHQASIARQTNLLVGWLLGVAGAMVAAIAVATTVVLAQT